MRYLQMKGYGLVAVAVCALVHMVAAKRYCKQDDDCEDLGTLQCIKSACDWGVCSCNRGFAAKYLGSTTKYRCVPLKKVGESCSNDGDTGICAAPASQCHETERVCKCMAGSVPVWGGEACVAPQQTTAGESCSPSIGDCQIGPSSCKTHSVDTYWHSPVILDRPTCACKNKQRLILPNYFSNGNNQVNSFTGKKVPTCVDLGIGDMCLKNSDCPLNGECTGNKCVCTSGHVPDYMMTACKKVLNFGDKCTGGTVNTAEYHCDGTKGLTCGDVCVLSDANPVPDSTCTCGLWHKKEGTSCTKIAKGGSCNGDMNCKGYSLNGICVDGSCQDSALALKAAMGTIAFVMVITQVLL